MSRPLPAPLAVFRTRRTWGELAYALAGLPQGIAFFSFTVVTLALGVGLSVTFLGLPLLAATGLLSRAIGNEVRRAGNALIGTAIAPPAPFHRAPGLFGWIGSCLRDGTAWRARLYLVLKLPLGVVSFAVAIAFWAYGLGGVTYALWRPFLPCNSSHGAACHHAIGIAADYYLDTPARIALTFVVALVLLAAAPWVVRGVVSVDRAAAAALLGPTARDRRVAELERSRAVVVDDSATTLRRIERDLHDGTQARLVALAMNVGLAREKLAEGGDPADARRLLDTAHLTAKQAIAEVRDLARGIHPPILDAGLDAALATLAAHSAVPVTVRTDLPVRPASAIETIAYFCAAELLTNVAKHSGASAASIEVRTSGHELVLTVHDDGRGGARAGGGTGLAGLSERAGTVDGTLRIVSPPGGPTVATVRLPMELS